MSLIRTIILCTSIPDRAPELTVMLDQKKKERDEEDSKMIQSMIDNQKGLKPLLTEPPVNRWTLRFEKASYEQKFQHHYQQDRRDSNGNNEQRTCASPRVGAFFDLIVSLVFLILISIACFLSFSASITWIVFCVLAAIIEIVTFIPVVSYQINIYS